MMVDDSETADTSETHVAKRAMSENQGTMTVEFNKAFPLDSTIAHPLCDYPQVKINLHTPCDLLSSESWDPTTNLSKGNTVRAYLGIHAELSISDTSDVKAMEEVYQIKLAFGHLVGDKVFLLVAVEEGSEQPSVVAFMDKDAFVAWLQPSPGIESVPPDGGQVCISPFRTFLKNELDPAMKLESLFDSKIRFIGALTSGCAYLGGKKGDVDFNHLYKISTLFPSKADETESSASHVVSDDDASESENGISSKPQANSNHEIGVAVGKAQRLKSDKDKTSYKKLEQAQCLAMGVGLTDGGSSLKSHGGKKKKGRSHSSGKNSQASGVKSSGGSKSSGSASKSAAATDKGAADKPSRRSNISGKKSSRSSKPAGGHSSGSSSSGVQQGRSSEQLYYLPRNQALSQWQQPQQQPQQQHWQQQQPPPQMPPSQMHVPQANMNDYELQAAKRARRNEKAALKVDEKKQLVMWSMVGLAGNTLNQLHNNAYHAARGNLASVAEIKPPSAALIMSPSVQLPAANTPVAAPPAGAATYPSAAYPQLEAGAATHPPAAYPQASSYQSAAHPHGSYFTPGPVGYHQSAQASISRYPQIAYPSPYGYQTYPPGPGPAAYPPAAYPSPPWHHPYGSQAYYDPQAAYHPGHHHMIAKQLSGPTSDNAKLDAHGQRDRAFESSGCESGTSESSSESEPKRRHKKKKHRNI